MVVDMNMKHPWEQILLSDYENHMQLNTVMQLQVLNDIMQQQLNGFPVNSAMVLGVAGGNGLEHTDPSRLRRLYGVDINREYLDA